MEPDDFNLGEYFLSRVSAAVAQAGWVIPRQFLDDLYVHPDTWEALPGLLKTALGEPWIIQDLAPPIGQQPRAEWTIRCHHPATPGLPSPRDRGIILDLHTTPAHHQGIACRRIIEIIPAAPDPTPRHRLPCRRRT